MRVKGAGHHLVDALLLRWPNMNRMRELGICGAWADGEEAELFRLSRASPQNSVMSKTATMRSSCGSLYKRAKSVQDFA